MKKTEVKKENNEAGTEIDDHALLLNIKLLCLFMYIFSVDLRVYLCIFTLYIRITEVL